MSRWLGQSISKTGGLLDCSQWLAGRLAATKSLSKEGQPVNMWQGHGCPRLSDLCLQWRLAHVVLLLQKLLKKCKGSYDTKVSQNTVQLVVYGTVYLQMSVGCPLRRRQVGRGGVMLWVKFCWDTFCPSVLEFIWMLLWHIPSTKHCCRPCTQLHGCSIPWWQWPPPYHTVKTVQNGLRNRTKSS